jgi:hypothetical protein
MPTISKTSLAQGTAHRVPPDMRHILFGSSQARAVWESLTPLARNEWICWVTSVKQQQTRQEHLARLIEDLSAGKRRPCCWLGCTHRTDKPMSTSQKYILGKKG